MTRPILAILALAAVAIALRIRRDARVWEPDEHEAGVPMTWSGQSATYLDNARTGVLTSYN